MHRANVYDFAVSRPASHLTRIFLSSTAKCTTPVSRSARQSLVKREQIFIHNKKFAAPTAANKSQSPFGCVRKNGQGNSVKISQNKGQD